MNCRDVGLDEYLDGELGEAERKAVEGHVASCADCRRELEEMRRLEAVLRAVPAGTPPDAEAFLSRVRERLRRPRWGALAAAASVMAAAALLLVATGKRGGGLRDALVRYSRSPSPGAEREIRAAGPRGVAALEAALEDPDPRIQFAAATLLFRFADDATRERVAGRYRGPVDVRAELERYSRSPSAEAELRIRSAGPVGMAVLEKALEDGDSRIRFAAAALLFRHADEPTREWVLARFRQRKGPDGPWALLEPGAEDEDVEIVPAAFSALEAGGQERWAMCVLRKIHRLDGAAQEKIVDSVVTLLKHPSPRIQRLALDIVHELDVRFPLSALVDLIDSPELGGEALRMLRGRVGEDHGGDKEAWRKAIALMERRL